MAQPITDEAVLRAGAALASGGWRYTRRQLYYAVCAAAEGGRVTVSGRDEMALGALIVLVGAVLIGVRPVGYVLAGIGVLLVLAGATHRQRHPAPQGRVIAMSYAEFCTAFAAVVPEGLITDVATPQPAEGDVIVVCDSDETAANVNANAARAELSMHAVTDAANKTPTTHVLCLHDASPSGCAIVAALHDEKVDVVDAGLRPKQLRADAEEQLLHGAPARLPRDLRAVLDNDEINWLLSGRRVELATRTPEQVMSMLRAAVEEQ
jgi:hypothetical protein